MAQAIASLVKKEGDEVQLLALLDAVPASPDEPLEYIEEEEIRTELDAYRAMFEMFDAAQLTRIAETVKSNMKLRRKFVPATYSGDALLFVATSDHDERALAEAWRPYVSGSIRVVAIDCGHLDMLQGAAVAEISRVLAEELGTPQVTENWRYAESFR